MGSDPVVKLCNEFCDAFIHSFINAFQTFKSINIQYAMHSGVIYTENNREWYILQKKTTETTKTNKAKYLRWVWEIKHKEGMRARREAIDYSVLLATTIQHISMSVRRVVSLLFMFPSSPMATDSFNFLVKKFSK